jgi:hypothetical protein
MVYVSTRGETGEIESGSGRRTDSYHQGADGEAGDSVLDQVRRTSSQQSRRGPHAVIVVGRLEGFAAVVNCLLSMQPCRRTHYPMATC